MATFLPEHLGNCDNDYFNFHHSFHIISPKFWKIKRVENFAKNLKTVKKQKSEIMKLTAIRQNYHLIM